MRVITSAAVVNHSLSFFSDLPMVCYLLSFFFLDSLTLTFTKE